MKPIFSKSNGVTYSDPSHPNYQVRVKTTRNAKALNGIQTDNVITEVIISDINNVTVGNQTGSDALSIRVRVSGSIHSNARLGKIIKALCADLPKWATENVYTGFVPVTSPTLPEE